MHQEAYKEQKAWDEFLRRLEKDSKNAAASSILGSIVGAVIGGVYFGDPMAGWTYGGEVAEWTSRLTGYEKCAYGGSCSLDDAVFEGGKFNKGSMREAVKDIRHEMDMGLYMDILDTAAKVAITEMSSGKSLKADAAVPEGGWTAENPAPSSTPSSEGQPTFRAEKWDSGVVKPGGPYDFKEIMNRFWEIAPESVMNKIMKMTQKGLTVSDTTINKPTIFESEGKTLDELMRV